MAAVGPVDVLCSHMPPAVDDLRFDVVAGRPEPGSQALLDYVEEHQPDYLYFGHVHQPRRSRLRVGRTWLVNVGYFRGTGACWSTRRTTIAGMAEHAEGSTEVHATAAEVMAVVADFEAYPEWVGNLEEVEVLARDRRGRGTRVAFRLGTPLGRAGLHPGLPLPATGRGHVLDVRGGDAGGPGRLLRPGAGRRRTTRVTYRLEVALGCPPGFLMRQAAKQIVRSALSDLKRRVESM